MTPPNMVRYISTFGTHIQTAAYQTTVPVKAVVETDSSETKIKTAKFFRNHDRDGKIRDQD